MERKEEEANRYRDVKKTSVEHFLADAKKDAFIIQKICRTVGTGGYWVFFFRDWQFHAHCVGGPPEKTLAPPHLPSPLVVLAHGINWGRGSGERT